MNRLYFFQENEVEGFTELLVKKFYSNKNFVLIFVNFMAVIVFVNTFKIIFMKKIVILLFGFALITTAFASYVVVPSAPKKAMEIYLPLGKNMQISLKDLSQIRVKDYEKLTGNHLNFFQKMSFKAGQKKLRNSISADGTIKNQRLSKLLSAGDVTNGFNIGWFALGLFLGLIGVLLSYIIKGDAEVKKNRQKWAWIGFGVWIVILLLTLVL